MKTFSVFLALAVAAQLGAAAPVQIDVNTRCREPELQKPVPRIQTNKIENFRPTVIPVIFHVFYRDMQNGYVPLESIRAQIDALNSGYAGADTIPNDSQEAPRQETMIRWVLQGVNYHGSSSYFNGCDSMNTAMKQSVSFNADRVLNVWVCNTQYLGYVQGFAWDEQESDNMQGIVLNWKSFPNFAKSMPSFNEGKTLVHEAGHYLGLFHTFQTPIAGIDKGRTCKNGDEVADTPDEASPAWGRVCYDSRQRDSCPNSPGFDPVRNYMDYSDDVCLNQFTPGQVDRVHDTLVNYLPIHYSMQHDLSCVASGAMGSANAFASCSGDCQNTTTPDGQVAPAEGWCFTIGNQKQWGSCCCGAACPMFNAKQGCFESQTERGFGCRVVPTDFPGSAVRTTLASFAGALVAAAMMAM